jgi:signal transduction histidine kinase
MAPGGSGQGLVGMRERAAVYGGSLRATPLSAGGFEVRAHWPTIAQATADPPCAPTAAKERMVGRRLTPRRLDLLLSAGWLVALEVEALTSPHRSGPLALTLVAVAGMASAAMFRRRAPLLFVVAIGAIAIALSGGVAAPDRASVAAAYPVLMGGYAAAAYSPLRRAMVGLGILLTGLVVANVLQHSAPGTVFGGALMSCVVWIVGRVVRDQRELATQLRAANHRLESERDVRAAFVVEAERLRIAEDLQAIVARAVALMVLQAENADVLLGGDPDRAGPALAAIENTGRQTLTHLRRMLGILRSPREPAPRSPSVTTHLPDAARAVPAGEPS